MISSIDPEIQLNLEGTSAANETSVFINKIELEEIIQQVLAKKIKAMAYSSNDVPDLKKLLASRFKQFFIWPALLSRPKNKPLQLWPVLEKFEFDLFEKQQSDQINIKMTLGQWVVDDAEPMVYFRSQANLNNATKSQVLLSELNNSYVWNNSYLQKKCVSDRISISLVDSTLQKLVQEKINNIVLSQQDSFLKRIKSFYLNSGVLQIYLK